MTRQAIDGGGWFNPDAAQKFIEETRFDGRNRISVPTGSQWEHEALYCTRRGVYVLNSWSQWQGSRERWTRVSTVRAADWLTANGYAAADTATAHAQADAEV